MAKVTNLTPKHLEILRWKILPLSSTLLNPAHELVNSMPDELAYSDNMKRLADEGVLKIEGYVPPHERMVDAPPKKEEEVVRPKTSKPKHKDE